MRAAGWKATPLLPFGGLVSRLPQLPPSAALALALNVAIHGELGADTLDALLGKVVRIAVRDAGLSLTVSYDRGWFRPRLGSAPADVTFSATLRDFMALALRDEDPDTLFFARRLLIEGDTELGLVLKNALDAIDTSRLTRFVEPLRRGSQRGP